MANVRPLAISILVVVGALTLAGPAPLSGPNDAWSRLNAMPPELRDHLAEQLKAFDLMSRAEQESVRALDRKIASEPEENRAAYYGVLRRYHLWVRSLPEAQRNELNAAAPSDRFALVTKLVAEGKGRGKLEPSFFHYSDFGGVSPFDLAARIDAWFKLDAAQKVEVGKLSPADRTKRMNQYVRELKIHVARPSATEVESIYQSGVESGRFPFLKKAEEKKKQAHVKHRFVDNYYFVVHPPAKVRPDALLQFDQSLPGWLRGGFDTLPPEEARRRLTILYRLVYPRSEIGTASKTETDKSAAGKTPTPPAPPPSLATPPPSPKPAARKTPF